MKNIYILFISFILILGSSCSDLLDTYPKDKVSAATFWKSKNDVELALAGCYRHLKTCTILSDCRPYLDGMTDNGYAQHEEDLQQIQLGLLNPTTGSVVSIYTSMYKGITACYVFLENFDRIKDGLGYSEQQQNQIIAEVRLLKAYYYFELVQRFGGVVIYDQVPTIEISKIKQKTFEESIQYVLSDLDFAISNLPNQTYKGHVVKNTALGLKARVALFMKDWNQVKSLTSEIINSESEGKTSLSKDYEPIFIKRLGQEDCSEILFAVEYLAPDAKQWHGIEIKGFYWSGITPFESFMSVYDSNDRRFKEWYYKAIDGRYLRPTDNTLFMPTNTTHTGWGLVKFFDKTNLGKYGVNPYDIITDDNAVLMRYAEILLMYAEAVIEAEGGSTTDVLALSSVNRIRERAGLNKIEGPLTREVLRKERRLELAFEGFRLFDLHRWRIAEEVMNGFESVAGSCVFEPHQYIWPFPQSEIDVNPQLVQNQGY